MNCIRHVLAGVLATAAAGAALAAEGPVPTGVPHLDHLFVIMMENHTFLQVVGNPTMPYINRLIDQKKVSLARSYFAVGHPSLTNYLEIVGGSNFGVRSDNPPDWHNHDCKTNLATGVPNADDDSGKDPAPPYPIDTGDVCPISGVGKDAVTEAVDNWNETSPPVFNFLPNIDGVRSVPAAANTSGKTIADQLAAAGLSWKTYQENLPLTGADLVNNSNGTASDTLTHFNDKAPLSFKNLPPLTTADILHAYAVKHNPFAYFQSVQEGTEPNSSLANMVGFAGAQGLYADLGSGNLPAFAYIVPNQCNDQHGQNNADAFCTEDQGVPMYQGLTNGTQAGLNPGLSANADASLNRIVTSIEHSPGWRKGSNAIVIVWDENDYGGVKTALPAGTPWPAYNLNRVVLTVETNSTRQGAGATSTTFYDSFSLLKSMEAAFHLPCLNHACDADVQVMSDLFVE